MATTEALRDLVEPIVVGQDMSLFDLELSGGVLKVTVDRTGGVDLDEIAVVTRALSRALDESDPIASRYTLEVTSPGLERVLRTPDHYAWAVGQEVSVKTVGSFEGERRLAGTLTSADDRGVVVTEPGGEAHSLSYDQIARARTVFEWGPAPKPGSPEARGRKASIPKASTEKRVEAS